MTEDKLRTKEEYKITPFGQHQLILITEVKLDGKWQELDRRKFTLPKEVPKYITELDLWQHTDYQLKELDRLTKLTGNEKPTPEIIQEWKSWIEQTVI